MDVVVPWEIAQMSFGAGNHESGRKHLGSATGYTHLMFRRASEFGSIQVKEIGPVIAPKATAAGAKEIPRKDEGRDTSRTSIRSDRGTIESGYA